MRNALRLRKDKSALPRAFVYFSGAKKRLRSLHPGRNLSIEVLHFYVLIRGKKESPACLFRIGTGEEETESLVIRSLRRLIHFLRLGILDRGFLKCDGGLAIILFVIRSTRIRKKHVVGRRSGESGGGREGRHRNDEQEYRTTCEPFHDPLPHPGDGTGRTTSAIS